MTVDSLDAKRVLTPTTRRGSKICRARHVSGTLCESMMKKESGCLLAASLSVLPAHLRPSNVRHRKFCVKVPCSSS